MMGGSPTSRPTRPRPWRWPVGSPPPDGLICVTGSLFLAAETRAILLHRDDAPAARPALT